MINKSLPLIIVILALSSFAMPFIYFKTTSESKMNDVVSINVGESSMMQEELDKLTFQKDITEVAKIFSMATSINKAENIPMGEKSPDELLKLIESEIKTLIDLGVKMDEDYLVLNEPVAFEAKYGDQSTLMWEVEYAGEEHTLTVVYSSAAGKIMHLNTTYADYDKDEKAKLIANLAEYYTGETVEYYEFYQSDYYMKITSELLLTYNFEHNQVFTFTLMWDGEAELPTPRPQN